MAKEVIYGSEVVIKYEDLPLADSVQFLNTVMTLSSVPENFTFIEDPNPPITVIVSKKAEPISLVV